MPYRPYQKIYALGHKANEGLLQRPLWITEKIDGSQFSWMLDIDEHRNETLHIWTHHQDVSTVTLPFGLFTEAIAWVRENKNRFRPNFIYYGEVLQKPKHNILQYQRVPKNHIILWDISNKPGGFLDYMDMVQEGNRIGLETVPLIFYGLVTTERDLENLISRPSILGGQVEGLVLKDYKRFSDDGHPIMGKYLSKRFQEIKEKSLPKPGEDWMDTLAKRFSTEARWDKAVIHLAEQGKLLLDPKDIAELLREIARDFDAECKEEVKEALWARFAKDIKGRVMSGFPQWYKDQLVQRAFDSKMSAEHWPIKSMLLAVDEDAPDHPTKK